MRRWTRRSCCSSTTGSAARCATRVTASRNTAAPARRHAGGYWTLYTTCDTAVSGTSCNFDILLSADARVVLDNVQGADLDPSDAITLGTDGSINLVTDTTYGMNGLTFDADPGAVIEADVLLDGVPQPQFVFVVSDGRLLSGVPTNPVDFAPAAP
jgi:hypothetical protein